MNKPEKSGNNDNSQKIRKYLSSPKEAPKIAEAAFLGASTMFETSFGGDLGCCQVLPSWKPVFIRVSGISMFLPDACFGDSNACVFGVLDTGFFSYAVIELLFFSVISLVHHKSRNRIF